MNTFEEYSQILPSISEQIISSVSQDMVHCVKVPAQYDRNHLIMTVNLFDSWFLWVSSINDLQSCTI